MTEVETRVTTYVRFVLLPTINERLPTGGINLIGMVVEIASSKSHA